MADFPAPLFYLLWIHRSSPSNIPPPTHFFVPNPNSRPPTISRASPSREQVDDGECTSPSAPLGLISPSLILNSAAENLLCLPSCFNPISNVSQTPFPPTFLLPTHPTLPASNNPEHQLSRPGKQSTGIKGRTETKEQNTHTTKTNSKISSSTLNHLKPRCLNASIKTQSKTAMAICLH